MNPSSWGAQGGILQGGADLAGAFLNYPLQLAAAREKVAAIKRQEARDALMDAFRAREETRADAQGARADVELGMRRKRDARQGVEDARADHDRYLADIQSGRKRARSVVPEEMAVEAAGEQDRKLTDQAFRQGEANIDRTNADTFLKTARGDGVGTGTGTGKGRLTKDMIEAIRENAENEAIARGIGTRDANGNFGVKEGRQGEWNTMLDAALRPHLDVGGWKNSFNFGAGGPTGQTGMGRDFPSTPLDPNLPAPFAQSPDDALSPEAQRTPYDYVPRKNGAPISQEEQDRIGFKRAPPPPNPVAGLPPAGRQRFDALPPERQAQIERLLNGTPAQVLTARTWLLGDMGGTTLPVEENTFGRRLSFAPSFAGY